MKIHINIKNEQGQFVMNTSQIDAPEGWDLEKTLRFLGDALGSVRFRQAMKKEGADG